MALDYYVAIDNAREQLEPLLPAYAAGQLHQPELPHAFGILFRQYGTCRMLVEGHARPLLIAQMQSASLYLHALPSLPLDEQATSFAACWWDAIAGGYWDAAREIARLSRATPNPQREHEDDFLYVRFLMERSFLAPEPVDQRGLESHAAQQVERLARWEEVLEAGADPRLELCRALQDHDSEAFQAALIAAADARRASLEKMQAKGTLLHEQAIWVKPVWPEGLALLRLAERDGLGGDFQCPDVPPLLRTNATLPFDRNAWRQLDYQPSAQ